MWGGRDGARVQGARGKSALEQAQEQEQEQAQEQEQQQRARAREAIRTPAESRGRRLDGGAQNVVLYLYTVSYRFAQFRTM